MGSGTRPEAWRYGAFLFREAPEGVLQPECPTRSWTALGQGQVAPTSSHTASCAFRCGSESTRKGPGCLIHIKALWGPAAAREPRRQDMPSAMFWAVS